MSIASKSGNPSRPVHGDSVGAGPCVSLISPIQLLAHGPRPDSCSPAMAFYDLTLWSCLRDQGHDERDSALSCNAVATSPNILIEQASGSLLQNMAITDATTLNALD